MNRHDAKRRPEQGAASEVIGRAARSGQGYQPPEPAWSPALEQVRTPSHPCTFSPQLLPVLRAELAGRRRVLDPFAGVGTFLQLIDDEATGVGVELEPEWASARPEVICADSRRLVDLFGPDSFDAVVSSPVYPNGCADNFNAGAAGGQPGRRHTYRQALSRPLSPGSLAGCGRGLGPRHDDGHREIAAAIAAVLQPGGRLVWNVKNVIVAGEVVPVVDWWASVWSELGLVPLRRLEVACPGIRHGANRHLRVPTESVLVFDKPAVAS